MNLSQCLDMAKGNGYSVVEFNEYSFSQQKPVFAKISTIENIIEEESRYKAFASANWQFRLNSGKIWCDNLGVVFYLWAHFPRQAVQFDYE